MERKTATLLNNRYFQVLALIFLIGLLPFETNCQDFISSHLPIVVINTNDIEIEDEPKRMVNMGIIHQEGQMNHKDDPFNEYNGKIGIEFRGNSTQDFDKKSYSIELWDSQGNDIDASLLGMPEEEDWILYGAPIDKTHIRNVMSFEIWRKMGYWASNTRFVELIIDEEYRGTYILMEKVKRDKNRLDIAKLTENDLEGDELTGGYIIRMDWPEGEAWESEYPSLEGTEMIFQYYYPKADNIQFEQKNYIQEYVNQFEEAIFSDDFMNNENRRYSELIDLNSFVDLFIVNELSRSVDAYKLSSFLHKDKNSNGGLLKAGPIWDFNLAYGNTNYCGGAKISGWTFKQDASGCDDLYLMPRWWERMIEDCIFREILFNRWTSYRNSFLNKDFLFDFIDQQVEKLGEAIDRNFETWDHIGENQWDEPYPIPNSYEGEIQRLKKWLSDRIEWLDTQIKNDCKEIFIKEPDEEIRIFPNPSNEEITILFNEREYVILQIFDFKGQLISEIEDLKDEYIIEGFGLLPSGPYLLKLFGEDDFEHTEIVLKQ